jgi:hypothetical protein
MLRLLIPIDTPGWVTSTVTEIDGSELHSRIGSLQNGAVDTQVRLVAQTEEGADKAYTLAVASLFCVKASVAAVA